jgi:hypothetical protein
MLYGTLPRDADTFDPDDTIWVHRRNLVSVVALENEKAASMKKKKTPRARARAPRAPARAGAT